jgi:release factor glutamine methyltransferase
LTEVGVVTAALDAKLLVGHALGRTSLQMATGETDTVSAAEMDKVDAAMARRIDGESVARIIGEREFYGLAFGLNAATLEPRPDTELLVDLALEVLPPAGAVLDLGTGTGCIPIATLAQRADATGVAVDLSAMALAMAAQNAERHEVVDRLALRQGDWFGALDGEVDRRFDLIVSNPPYIASAVVDGLMPEVRDFDPRLALDGGPDGLAPYRIIATEAAAWLKLGGTVLVEIGYDQGEAVLALFTDAGFAEVRLYQDLNGLDRVVRAHHIL